MKIDFERWPLLAPVVAIVCGMLFTLHLMGFIGRTPKIGDIYELRSNHNPWAEKAQYVVMDVKNGYVLWKHQYSTPIACKFTIVRSMYKHVGITTNIPPVNYERE